MYQLNLEVPVLLAGGVVQIYPMHQLDLEGLLALTRAREYDRVKPMYSEKDHDLIQGKNPYLMFIIPASVVTIKKSQCRYNREDLIAFVACPKMRTIM